MNKRQDLIERVNRLSGRKGNWVGRRKTMPLKIDAKHDQVKGELQPVSHNQPPELVGREEISPQLAPTAEGTAKANREAARERLRETVEKARQMQRPDRFPRGQPFQAPAIPPGVKIAKSAKLAMDDATNWAASQFAAAASGTTGVALFNEGLGFMGYPLLAELSQRPEYRVIVETIATDMTRKWIKLKAKSEEEDKTEKISELMEALEEFKVKEVFEQCEEIDGYFGRAHLYIDTGDTDDPKELLKPLGNGWNKISQAKFGKGDLKRLVPVEPVWTYPAEYNSNNPLKPDWYNPQRWFVMASEVHQSRLLKFVGREVPDLLKPAYSFGGLALTQMCKPYVTNWLNTRQSVADIIQAFSVFVVATNMQATLQEGGDDALVRANLFNIIRTNAGLFMIDKDSEDFMNVSAPLGTLDQLQAQSQEQMASISRIPLVKLLGISPHGLNATAEPELKAYNDAINAAQEKRMRPNLTRVLGFLMLHLWGEVDEDIDFEFISLNEATEKEKAEIQKMRSEIDSINITNATIDPEEARARIASDPDSIYQGLDPDDMPEPPEEEDGEGGMPGAGQPPGAGGVAPGGQRKPDKGAAADSVIPFAFDEWKEADHPRGNPKNAGQFSKGGGGGGKKAAMPDIPDFLKKVATGKHGGGWSKPAGGVQTWKGSSGEKLSASAPPKPLKMGDLKKVGAQMGSNEGGVYENAEGEKFYVKKGKTKEHVTNEITAANLYRLAGLPTLRYMPIEGGQHVATRMQKLDKNNVKQLSDTEKRYARDAFMTHAWLSNWDAAGTGGDNQGVVKGIVTTLDVGGSLEYRAQGGPKGKAFGGEVAEIETMRDPKMSPDAAKLFGAMSPAEMRRSARRVTRISDEKIKAVVAASGGKPELAEKLIARRDDIAEKMKQFGAEGSPAAKNSTVIFEAGGKMPVKELNGIPFEQWYAPAEDGWSGVGGTMPDLDEPKFEPRDGLEAASGVIIREPDGRVWLVQPKNGYGGYEGTFPKGRAEEGLTLQENAIKEAYEESGLKVKITGYAGDFDGDTTTTRYYFAEREAGDPSKPMHGNETEGVVLAPKDKAAGFLNRDRDRKVLAQDEATWEESKHPRDKQGQFTSSGSGGGKAAEIDKVAAGLKSDAPKPMYGGQYVQIPGNSAKQNHEATVTSVLVKPTKIGVGSHYRDMLQKLIKDSKEHGTEDKVPALKQKLHEAFLGFAKLLGEQEEKETDPAKQKKFAELAAKAYKKAKEFKVDGPVSVPISTPAEKPAAKPVETKKEPPTIVIKGPGKEAKSTPTTKPSPAPMYPAPTEHELTKAKKNVKLQVQYVPGAPGNSPEAQKLVDAFNAKYEGKDLSGNAPALIQKVNDFKKLQADMVPLMSEAQKIAAEKAQKQAEANAAAAKAAKEAFEKTLATPEAKASFEELSGVTGSSYAESYVKTAAAKIANNATLKASGISPADAAHIVAYSGQHYAGINKALRAGVMTKEQALHVKQLDAALDKLPNYTSTTYRKMTISDDEFKKWKQGMVVTQHGFSSSAKSKGVWSGAHHLTIHGKTGKDIQPLSLHSGEQEVLFKSGTKFFVKEISGNQIVVEEI